MCRKCVSFDKIYTTFYSLNDCWNCGTWFKNRYTLIYAVRKWKTLTKLIGRCANTWIWHTTYFFATRNLFGTFLMLSNVFAQKLCESQQNRYFEYIFVCVFIHLSFGSFCILLRWPLDLRRFFFEFEILYLTLVKWSAAQRKYRHNNARMQSQTYSCVTFKNTTIQIIENQLYARINCANGDRVGICLCVLSWSTRNLCS